jgi:hypothetical protein
MAMQGNTCQEEGKYYHCKKLGHTNLWGLLLIALEPTTQQLLHMLACIIDEITTRNQTRIEQRAHLFSVT